MTDREADREWERRLRELSTVDRRQTHSLDLTPEAARVVGYCEGLIAASALAIDVGFNEGYIKGLTGLLDQARHRLEGVRDARK